MPLCMSIYACAILSLVLLISNRKWTALSTQKEGPTSKPNSSRSSICQEQNSFTTAHRCPFENQHVFESVWPPSILLGHDQHMTCMSVWNKDASMGKQNTWNLSLQLNAQCKLFWNIIKSLV